MYEIIEIIDKFDQAINPDNCENLDIQYRDQNEEAIHIKSVKGKNDLANYVSINSSKFRFEIKHIINKNNNSVFSFYYYSRDNKIPLVKIVCTTSEKGVNVIEEIDPSIIDINIIFNQAITIIVDNNPLIHNSQTNQYTINKKTTNS